MFNRRHLTFHKPWFPERRIDAAAAILLEQRIIAYADIARSEGRTDGIIAALKKAEVAARRMRGGQKIRVEKIIGAVKGALPQEAAIRHDIAQAGGRGYYHGYSDDRKGHRIRPAQDAGQGLSRRCPIKEIILLKIFILLS